MNTLARPPGLQGRAVSYFQSGEALRSRSVGAVVHSARLDVPMPSARLLAHWEREASQDLALELGDVEVLRLARARMCWPDYRRCVHAASDWTHSLGLPGTVDDDEVALMACRGAKYHHDGAHYGAVAFCNLFLSEDAGLDLHFPQTGHRIPLARGTAVLFDPSQPHGVIVRGRPGFEAAEFPAGQDCLQVFLTWEVPIERLAVAQALGVELDIDPLTSGLLDEAQVWVSGRLSKVSPESGAWRLTGPE